MTENRPDRNLAIRIAFDGTRYSGWQWQSNAPTLQGEMEAALEAVAGHPHRFTASSSRTDAGVHALALVANVFTFSRLEPDTLGRALNAKLPRDIRVTGVADMPQAFHSRREAVSKVYRYLLWRAPVESPFWNRYAWFIHAPLDMERLHRMAEGVVGNRDFRAFTVTGGEAEDTRREIFHVRWEGSSPWLHCTFEGAGFLRHMVRRLVGGMVESAAGRLPNGIFEAALEGEMTAAPVIHTAPARGLWLLEARYPPETSPRWSVGEDTAGTIGFPPPLSGLPALRAPV